MAVGSIAAHAPEWRDTARRAMVRSGSLLAAAALLLAVLALGFALASYHPADPSLNTAAEGPTRNLIGAPGAWVADLLLTLFGPPAALLLPLLLIVGLRLWRGAPAGRWRRSLGAVTGGLVLLGIALTLLRGGSVGGLPQAGAAGSACRSRG